MPDEERHLLLGDAGGGEDQVALVLAVGVVDHDDHASGRECGDGAVHRGGAVQVIHGSSSGGAACHARPPRRGPLPRTVWGCGLRRYPRSAAD
jgi:hypothetical protein